MLPGRTKKMNLEKLIKPESVLCNVSARSKKHCLEILSELLTRETPDIASEEVFSRLIERERLGCTSLDKDIAFPRCRVPGLDNSHAALLVLVKPIDFDSVDGESVNIVFGLMVPEDLDEADFADIEAIAGLLRLQSLRDQLNGATSSKQLYDILIARGLEVSNKDTSGET